MEAVFVNFHCGYGIDAGKRKQHDEVVRKLIPVVYKITDLGVRNNIENLYSEQRNSDFCKIGDRLSDFQKIFESIDSSMLKLCYDYGHENSDGNGIDILREFYDRLGSIHAHKGMSKIIEAEPKKIAALVFELQKQLNTEELKKDWNALM